MPPRSKRSKPNPPAHDKNEATASSRIAAPNNGDAAPTVTNLNESDESALRKQRSWYGTWPRVHKSAALAKVTAESIMATKPANTSTADLSKFEPGRTERSTSASSRPPSMYLGKSKETSGLTTSDETMDVDKKADGGKPPVTSDSNVTAASIDNQDSSMETTPTSTEDTASQRPATSAGFLSYIPIVGGWASSTQQPVVVVPPNQPEPENSRENPSGTNETSVPSVPSGKNVPNGSHESSSWPWPWSSPSANAGAVETSISQPPIEATEDPPTAMPLDSEPNASKGSGSSRQWLSVFSLSSNDSVENKSTESQPLLDSVEKSNKSNNTPTEDTPQFKDGSQPASGSSWAFFSNKKSGDIGSQTESGELAVIGDKSQNKPEPATIQSPSKTRKESTSAADIIPTPEQIWLTSSQNHLLMPDLRETYKYMENPSILQQLARIVRLSRDPPTEHVSLMKEPPKIKKAVAIGVHGLFPGALIQSILGVPTGTSKLFADHAAAAIHRFTRTHGYKCDVRGVHLHFEGKIAARVEQLWKMLLNYIAEIQSADLVMFACHSQGVPVAVMLASKLIDLGVINSSSTRIGICAMAGVNLGPFLHYKNRTTRNIFSGTTGYELFDLADSESILSKAYVEALRKVIRFGAKVAYIGSVDDQLVSMESSTFTPVHHPYIYRAVFVDGRLHKPDFIIKLVGFALKLRNMGVKDHGLIRELSVALAGPLMTGQGHSVVYDDPKVYDLAVQHTIETTTIGDVDLKVHPYNTSIKPDQYFLPFVIRGVLDEDLVKTELSQEVAELLKQFDDWQPANSQLQDVKVRLRAIKSML